MPQPATQPRPHASPARLVAALALALGLFALVAPARGEGPAEGALQFRSGHADWGLKESFRNYVGGIAHGEISVSGGAGINPDGTYSFPLVGGDYDLGTHAVHARMRGTVRFRGHESPPESGNFLLDVTVSSPRIEIAGSEGLLYADVVGRSLESGEYEEHADVALAALEPGEASEQSFGATGGSWTGVPATLTEAGAPAFGGFYTAGEELDPLSLTVSTEDAEEEPPDPEPGGGSEPGSSTGSPGPSPADVAAHPPLLLPSGSKVRTVRRNGVVVLARVACRPPMPCLLRTRRLARVRVGRRAFRARVIAPRAVPAGGWAQVRLWLPKGARSALRGRRGRVAVPVVVRSGDRRVARGLRAVLRTAPGRRGAGRGSR